MDARREQEYGTVIIDGALLAYQEAGRGRTLVLLHEGIADSRMFDDQFDVLAEHCHVVRFDFFGYGHSGVPTVLYAHHEALRGLLDHLGIARAALFGMSLGGIVALDFALSYPERVEALMLFAAGIGGYQPSAAGLALAKDLEDAWAADDVPRAIELSVQLWVDGPDRTPDEVDPAVRERVREMFTGVMRRSRENNRRTDDLEPPALGRLHEITAPTLVAVGTGDLPDLRYEADLLASTIPHARKVELPRVAHVFNVTTPPPQGRRLLRIGYRCVVAPTQECSTQH